MLHIFYTSFFPMRKFNFDRFNSVKQISRWAAEESERLDSGRSVAGPPAIHVTYSIQISDRVSYPHAKTYEVTFDENTSQISLLVSTVG